MWPTADLKLVLRRKRRADEDASMYTANDIIGGEFYDSVDDSQGPRHVLGPRGPPGNTGKNSHGTAGVSRTLTANGRTSASRKSVEGPFTIQSTTEQIHEPTQSRFSHRTRAAFGETLHADELVDAFRSPPDAARPGVYWYFHDGSPTRQAMTNDLKSMQRVGLGSVVFLEVAIGVSRRANAFHERALARNFAHAVRATERLGMEFILGTGPGWAGSGGPWIDPADSMWQLVGQAHNIERPGVSAEAARSKTPPASGSPACRRNCKTSGMLGTVTWRYWPIRDRENSGQGEPHRSQDAAGDRFLFDSKRRHAVHFDGR